MKGIIILIVILAVIGIWWARRTPEPITGVEFQPESVNAENGINGNDGDGTDSQDDNGDGTIDPEDADKG